MSKNLLGCGLVALLVLSTSMAQADEPPQGAPAVVTVTAAGRPHDVTLERLEEPGTAVDCVTPCTLSVWPGRYQLHSGGRGVRSFEDTINVPDAGLDLRLHAASKPKRVWGIVLTGFGGATLALGAVFVASALLSAPGDSYNQSMAAVMGVSTGLIGGGSLITGLLLLDKSRVGMEQGERPPRAVITF
jgi:hypothetical protein